MIASPKHSHSSIQPCLRYRDAARAMDWLCRTFGFEQQLVVPGEDGTIAHAQLTLNGGMIMLGSVGDSEYGRLIKEPCQLGGATTQGCYITVADADAVYRRVRENGAEIVLDIKDEEYGGRGFTCRDREGHVWSVGTYDPW